MGTKKSKGLGFLGDINNNVDNITSSPADAINKVGAANSGINGFVDGINDSVDTVDKTITKTSAIYKQAKGFPGKIGDTKKKVIDIGSRFQNAFGFVSGNVGKSLTNTNIKSNLSGTVIVKDGRSSYEEFTLRRNGTEIKFAYTGFLQQQDGVLAPPPLVSFKRGKRIEESIVSSNDANGTEIEFGQVVEAFGRKPVDITIKGILVDMVNHQYPGDKVRKLMDLFDEQGIWDVEGQVFRDHKVQSIYFVDCDDEAVQGFMDTWSFTLQAKSIKSVEYFLNTK